MKEEKKDTLVGKTARLYTKKGFFYKGDIIKETETHVTIHDFKTDKDIMFSLEWVAELITEGGDK